MKITKQRLKQIIREELLTITEGRAAMAGRANDAFDDLDQQTGTAPRRSQPKAKPPGGEGRAGLDSRAAAAQGDLDQRTASPKAPAPESDGQTSDEQIRAKQDQILAKVRASMRPRNAGTQEEQDQWGTDFADALMRHGFEPTNAERMDQRRRMADRTAARKAAKAGAGSEKMVKHRKYPGPDLGSGDKKAFRKAFAAAKKGAHKFFWFDKGKGRKPYAVK